MIVNAKSLLAAFLFIASVSAAAAGQVTLGSGRSVEILALGPLNSTAGWSALSLKYRTATALDDIPALRQEAGEIWNRFIVDVERAKYEKAVIMANGPEKGAIITTNQSFNFVYEKKNGIWHEDEGYKPDAKLDSAAVHAFFNRMDLYDRLIEANSFFLYVADDCVITVSDQSKKPATTETLDRQKFWLATVAAQKTIKHSETHRDILDIKIADDGRSAQVLSTETTDATLADREIRTEERDVDTIEIRGRSLLLAKSISVIEKSSETRND